MRHDSALHQLGQAQKRQVAQLANQIEALASRIDALEGPSHWERFLALVTQKGRELYWTGTRLLGLAHWHDGSRVSKSALSVELERIPRFGMLPLRDETYITNLAYVRLCAAEKLLASSPSPRPAMPSRPRLAYVSPLPPQKTGVANYSAELIPALSRHYEVDVIVAAGAPSKPLAGCSSIHDSAWFEQHAHEYDRILYHFGNSAFHDYMYPLMEKFPGVVALHDFFLGHGLYAIEEEETNARRSCYHLAYALYNSHGYPGLGELFGKGGPTAAVHNYPASFFVFQQAQAVVLHSHFADELVRRFFGQNPQEKCHIVPLARTLPQRPDRLHVRDALGVERDVLLVCSFGFLSSAKQNDRLVNAWIKSGLAGDPGARLVFVGESPDPKLTQEIDELIAKNGLANVAVTGYLQSSVYRDYLAAADIAVQLRMGSRGETSGAVLDCMSYGLATIVNRHGSFAELPDEGAVKIPEDFSDEELVEALELLAADGEKRRRIGARAIVAQEFSPERSAELYHDIIEACATSAAPLFSTGKLIEAARGMTPDADRAARIETARRLCASSPATTPARQLLVDVSALAQVDLRTGIQRVVRAQLIGLFNKPPLGWRIEPVRLSQENGRWRLRYARRFTCQLLGLDPDILDDDVVAVSSGDVYYMPDHYSIGVIGAAEAGIYKDLHQAGVTTTFVVYDVLPILYPHFFPSGAERIHADWLRATATNADQLICISKSVMDSTEACLSQMPEVTAPRLSYLHLGADIESSAATLGIPNSAPQVLSLISQRPSFLMVGTIEPRKGHLQTLAGFERLWEENVDVNLIIVGAGGWTSLPDAERRTIPEIVKRLSSHPERGRRMLWLQDVSDEFLETIYAECVCLIAASEDEGFGLPLIEAARHKLPILARDIPVFREVASHYATYFSGSAGNDLAAAVRDWLSLYHRQSHRRSEAMPWRTWAESVDAVTELLIGEASGSFEGKTRRSGRDYAA